MVQYDNYWRVHACVRTCERGFVSGFVGSVLPLFFWFPLSFFYIYSLLFRQMSKTSFVTCNYNGNGDTCGERSKQACKEARMSGRTMSVCGKIGGFRERGRMFRASARGSKVCVLVCSCGNRRGM